MAERKEKMYISPKSYFLTPNYAELPLTLKKYENDLMKYDLNNLSETDIQKINKEVFKGKPQKINQFRNFIK